MSMARFSIIHRQPGRLEFCSPNSDGYPERVGHSLEQHRFFPRTRLFIEPALEMLEHPAHLDALTDVIRAVRVGLDRDFVDQRLAAPGTSSFRCCPDMCRRCGSSGRRS